MTTKPEDAALARVRKALVAEPSYRDAAAAELLWLGRNGTRVDVRLRDSTGREHHVVATEEGSSLTISMVLTEPDLVSGHTPVVVVANGPSGAGKSTLLAAIADASEIPWVVFDEPILGTTDQRMLLWRDRAPRLHAGFIEGIAALASAGNAVGVAAGGHPQSLFHEALASVSAVYVGLDCPVSVLIEREQGRAGRWGGLAVQSANAHDGWTYDLRVDTSQTTPTAAARAVLAMLP